MAMPVDTSSRHFEVKAEVFDQATEDFETYICGKRTGVSELNLTNEGI
jgi:hypothetical protein